MKPETTDKKWSISNVAKLLVSKSALIDLDLESARTLAHYMRYSKFDIRSRIFEEDSKKSKFMALILSGDVLIEKKGAEGRENIVLNVAQKGDIVGEMGLIDGQPRSADCISITEVEAAILDETGFLKLLDEEPKISALFLIALIKRMSNNIRNSNKKIKSLRSSK